MIIAKSAKREIENKACYQSTIALFFHYPVSYDTMTTIQYFVKRTAAGFFLKKEGVPRLAFRFTYVTSFLEQQFYKAKQNSKEYYNNETKIYLKETSIYG